MSSSPPCQIPDLRWGSCQKAPKATWELAHLALARLMWNSPERRPWRDLRGEEWNRDCVRLGALLRKVQREEKLEDLLRCQNASPQK